MKKRTKISEEIWEEFEMTKSKVATKREKVVSLQEVKNLVKKIVVAS